MTSYVQPIILCGGSGTRLWPLSNTIRPKQFVPIDNDKTLLQLTLDRISLIKNKCKQKDINCYEPILVMHKDHKQDYGYNVLYETYINDTGVAIARACTTVNSNEIMLVLPSDHYIENVDTFVDDIIEGIVNVTNDNIVLYGIHPTSPETKYGYILPTNTNVIFKEKPSKDIAIDLIKKGAMWNSGLFAAKVNTIYDNLGDLTKWVINPREGKAPSFDVAVLQKYNNIYAHKCSEWGWSDVGTWEAFTSIPEVKSIINSNSTSKNCNNIKILNYSNKNIVTIGCNDLLIVTHGNNILIMPSVGDYNNDLKEIASIQ